MIKDLIRAWYDKLWNPWDVYALEAIAAPSIHFRGSLGATLKGHDQVMAYMGMVSSAFPDFHNAIVAVFAAPDRPDEAVAHLRYTGTHRGVFRGIEPTGNAFTYEALVRFTARDGLLVDVQALGDTPALMQQLTGADAIPPRPIAPRQRLVPTLRSTDWDRSRAFWVQQLGMEVTFEWRHAPEFPVYAGLTGFGVALHLSEHTGDCEPGGLISIEIEDLPALRARLAAHGVDAPEPIDQPWKVREMTLTDPDGNKVTFCQPLP